MLGGPFECLVLGARRLGHYGLAKLVGDRPWQFNLAEPLMHKDDGNTNGAFSTMPDVASVIASLVAARISSGASQPRPSDEIGRGGLVGEPALRRPWFWGRFAMISLPDRANRFTSRASRRSRTRRNASRTVAGFSSLSSSTSNAAPGS